MHSCDDCDCVSEEPIFNGSMNDADDNIDYCRENFVHGDGLNEEFRFTDPDCTQCEDKDEDEDEDEMASILGGISYSEDQEGTAIGPVYKVSELQLLATHTLVALMVRADVDDAVRLDAAKYMAENYDTLATDEG